MDGGLAAWNIIVKSLKDDKTLEDSIIDMIHLYANSNAIIHWPFGLFARAVENKRFKCAKWILDVGLLKDMEGQLKNVFCHWAKYKDLLSNLFRFGVKLPATSVVLGWLSKTERRDIQVVKKIEFAAKLKSGGNNARKAALTMLAIVRFRRNEHMSHCINMDVMRMIARMIYDSGLTEWKVWKTGRRKSNRLQTKKRIKK